MQTHEIEKFCLHASCLLTVLAILLVCPSCNKKGATTTESAPAENETADFHADYDIAMTIKSIADAIKVGEPLDSAEYDFEGVLTDGQGSPLYTDMQGSPGIWQIDVLDKSNVMIRNLFLGDLLPSDLRQYILQSLRIGEANRIASATDDSTDSSDTDTEINIYDCDGVYLRFEVRAGMAPNGLEGPLLNIIMSSDPPSTVGTQTNA